MSDATTTAARPANANVIRIAQVARTAMVMRFMLEPSLRNRRGLAWLPIPKDISTANPV